MASNTLTLASAYIPIEWDKGSTFRKPFYWTTGRDRLNQARVDVSGMTAAMHIRDANDTLLIELTTENGGIELQPASYLTHTLPKPGGSVGVIEVYISDDTLAAQVWNSAEYDLELYFDNGDTRKLARGTFLLFDEQTKP